jgi:cell division protein FtsL
MSQVLARTAFRINGLSLQRPSLAPLLVAIVLMAVLSLVFVWSRLQAINLEYDIARLETQIRAESEEIKRLKVEAVHLASHERIDKLARRELGLRIPDAGQIVRIE